jgi:hypothetical protein
MICGRVERGAVMIKWTSEADELPKVAQKVLLATPRQDGEFWDLQVAQILIRHEGVVPQPVTKGGRWATDYYWGYDKDGMKLVTGNAWWAPLDTIPLPPGAEHKFERGYHYVSQPAPIFVAQRK